MRESRDKAGELAEGASWCFAMIFRFSSGGDREASRIRSTGAMVKCAFGGEGSGRGMEGVEQEWRRGDWPGGEKGGRGGGNRHTLPLSG